MQDIIILGIGTAIGYALANRIEDERKTQLKKRIELCKTIRDHYDFKHFKPEDVFMICLEADQLSLEHYKKKD
jgi:hypothetical protein